MIIEYWDLWYSYKMGLLRWDSGDYYGTDTVELVTDQHPITNGLDQEVEVYDEPWAVLYGASLNSLSADTEPLIYSWQSANEAAVIVDDARKIVATGIYDTTHYTDEAWELFDQILGYLHPAGGIIAPLGYTSLEFIDMIETKLEFAQTYESNGIVMTTIEIDEPLIYKGESPKTEFIGLSESEMAELGISPGDEAADSTPLLRKFYMLATEQADDNGDEEGIDFESQIIPVSVNLGEYFKFWGHYGSGLVYGRDSYIEIVDADTSGTEIDHQNPEFSLLDDIEDYRDDLIFGSNNPVIKLAVSDYAQVPAGGGNGGGGGPDFDEWGCLAGLSTNAGQDCASAGYHVVGAGDLVTKRQCKVTPPSVQCTGMTGHTMMVIGWTDREKTGIGATYFNKNRDFNWVLVIEGNANPEDQRGTSPIPGKGLTRVAINRKLVCQNFSTDPALGGRGDHRVISIPPEPDETRKCEIILRDTNPGNFNVNFNINGGLEGSFFGDFN